MLIISSVLSILASIRAQYQARLVSSRFQGSVSSRARYQGDTNGILRSDGASVQEDFLLMPCLPRLSCTRLGQPGLSMFGIKPCSRLVCMLGIELWLGIEHTHCQAVLTAQYRVLTARC